MLKKAIFKSFTKPFLWVTGSGSFYISLRKHLRERVSPFSKQL